MTLSGNTLHQLLITILGMLLALPASADLPSALSDCAMIDIPAERLACFDRIVPRSIPVDRPAVLLPVIGTLQAEATPGEYSYPVLPQNSVEAFGLSARWELGPDDQKGVFQFRPHKQNYLLPIRRTSSANDAPFRPLVDASPYASLGLDTDEIKYQLSFKVKVADNLFGAHENIWVAYTQQSHWQAYNSGVSSPFRETNYQPELMLVIPTNYSIAGLTGRFLNVGLVHQSNGRPDVLSRSWNRFYVQTGLERGDFSLLVRPWFRFREQFASDDNPDIADFLGHGDLLGVYKWRDHEFSLLARRNFHTGKGAISIDWAFPLYRNLKGYVQGFSGYGESLIDYNFNQNTIGLGVILTNW